MHPTAFKRGLTIAGVAIGSALLIAALAVAMRGLAPTASKASDQPGQAVRTLHRPAHRVMRRLASWHAPSVPKAHRRKATLFDCQFLINCSGLRRRQEASVIGIPEVE